MPWIDRSRKAVELTPFIVNVIEHIGAAIHSLQIERGLTVQTLDGKVSRKLLQSQREISDALIEQVKENMALAEIKLSPALIKNLNTLTGFYEKVDASSIVTRLAFAKYTEIIAELIRIISEDIGRNVSNPFAKKAIEAHVFLMQGKEEAGRVRGFVVGILAANRPINEDAFTFLSDIIKRQDEQLDDLFVKNGEPSLVKMYTDAKATPVFKEVLEMRALIIAQKDKGNFTISAPIWFAKKTETINTLRTIENASIDYILSLANK